MRYDRGYLPNGLRFARMGHVRVVLYDGSAGGSVQIQRGEHWGIARPGEVIANGVIVELTLAAASVQPSPGESPWTAEEILQREG